jgi:hypothetical protein
MKTFFALCGAVVLFAAPMLAQAAETPNPVCSGDNNRDGVNDCPTDPDTFLSFLESAVVENATTAVAYYAAIDPYGQKDTIAKWYTVNGFVDPAKTYSSTGPQSAFFDINAGIVSVIHENEADLGFVRLVSSRCDPDCDDANPKIYSVIENYVATNNGEPFAPDPDKSAFDNATDRTNRLASVTMEWTSAADGSNPSGRFVAFYAYTGTVVAFGADTDSRNLDGMPFAPNLDNRENSGSDEIPGLCNTCHGGQPYNLQAGVYPRHGDTDALFLPYDLDNFSFDTDPARPQNSKANQQPAYKAANQITHITHRSIEEFDVVAGFARVPAAQELIEGWYGGPDFPGDIFNGNFVPAGWLPPHAPAAVNGHNVEELYLKSIKPGCRACHVQQELSLDFGTYAGFRVYDITHKELVLDIECGIDDDPNVIGGDDQHVMPLALQTYERFWNPLTAAPFNVSEADVFKDTLFPDFTCDAGTGCHP